MPLMKNIIFLKRFLFPHEVQKGVKELVFVISISFQQGEGNTIKAFKFLEGKNLSFSESKTKGLCRQFLEMTSRIASTKFHQSL